MKVVPVDKLEPGMILAQNIERADGALLAGVGSELTPAVINMVRRMADLEGIAVEGSAFETEAEEKAWKKAELEKLIHRFSKVIDDPAMFRLRKLQAERIMSAK